MLKQQKQTGTIQAIPKKELDLWMLNARAFIAHAVEHHMSNTQILSNLSHDIFGLCIGDKLMLPRVSHYEEEHPFNESTTATGNPNVKGSSLGCLLPLLNKEVERSKPL